MSYKFKKVVKYLSLSPFFPWGEACAYATSQRRLQLSVDLILTFLILSINFIVFFYIIMRFRTLFFCRCSILNYCSQTTSDICIINWDAVTYEPDSRVILATISFYTSHSFTLASLSRMLTSMKKRFVRADSCHCHESEVKVQKLERSGASFDALTRSGGLGK